MQNNGSGKQKDWVLFPYDANNEKAIKIEKILHNDARIIHFFFNQNSNIHT